ncbi:hypothetical protein [Acidobacterium sp. S8]|uniref:hypothetical protein n=1 Tax=Acidobacterium sp. S8 TaxID=1641854 RepID=UPI0020B147BC|nr:hypothetical protein [Acidobacterium sp. S8]
MGIKELIGIESERKIRYAIVGLGDIAQEDMMPGVEHTGNSEISALITSDPVKADELGKKYGVAAVFGYENFRKRSLLESSTRFGGELKYFSECILNNENPEPEWRRRLRRCPGPRRDYCSARKWKIFSISSIDTVTANQHGASEDHFTGCFDSRTRSCR